MCASARQGARCCSAAAAPVCCVHGFAMLQPSTQMAPLSSFLSTQPPALICPLTHVVPAVRHDRPAGPVAGAVARNTGIEAGGTAGAALLAVGRLAGVVQQQPRAATGGRAGRAGKGESFTSSLIRQHWQSLDHRPRASDLWGMAAVDER